MIELALQFVANGLVNGSFYALSALGLTLIFGLMRVVNFAHGDLYVMGGIVGYAFAMYFGLGFFPGLVLMIVVMAAFGMLVDQTLIRPIRNQDEATNALVTIGFSIFLANTMLLVAGTTPLRIDPPVPNAPVFFGSVVVTQNRLFAVAASFLFIAAVRLLIQKTKLGRAMRATFQDADAAELVGIRSEWIYAITFALGTVMASIAGMLLATIYVTTPVIAGLVSMKSFVIVILAGMGSFAGAILGGLVLGVVEALWGGFVSTNYVDVIGFLLVIAILLLRPQGLFAVRSERV